MKCKQNVFSAILRKQIFYSVRVYTENSDNPEQNMLEYPLFPLYNVGVNVEGRLVVLDAA